MSDSLHALVDRLDGLTVLVIGEAMLDRYLFGTSDRLCPEAPVPVVTLRYRTEAAGAAANTALNARALGARVSLVSVVGADGEGETVRQALAARGVAVNEVVADPHRQTLVKQRLFASGQLLARFDQGSTGDLDAGTERRLVTVLTRLYAEHDVVLVSDYDYGVLTPAVVQALAHLQARTPRVLVVDAKRLTRFRDVAVSAVKPNYAQACALLGGLPRASAEDRAALIAAHGERLLDVTGAQLAAVTLDVDGAIFFERGRTPYRTYARPADHARAAGAGDTFAAALGLALAAGGELAGAAELAAAAAHVVVQKEGTSMCSVAELQAVLVGSEKYCPDAATLGERLEHHRREGRKIVFTNGCFDILHRGHIAYLNAAKALGGVLVVAVNGDASVTRLKGAGRPINTLEDRLQVLAALSSVDHVVPFHEDTPVALVRATRPDVYVKGGDYAPDMLPEARVVEASGGTVRILPYVEERSTTSIIERIQGCARGEAIRGPA